jgi:hypothetical protein
MPLFREEPCCARVSLCGLMDAKGNWTARQFEIRGNRDEPSTSRVKDRLNLQGRWENDRGGGEAGDPRQGASPGGAILHLVRADATHADPSSVRGVEPGSHRGRRRADYPIPGACMETEVSGMPRGSARACTYSVAEPIADSFIPDEHGMSRRMCGGEPRGGN